MRFRESGIDYGSEEMCSASPGRPGRDRMPESGTYFYTFYFLGTHFFQLKKQSITFSALWRFHLVKCEESAKNEISPSPCPILAKTTPKTLDPKKWKNILFIIHQAKTSTHPSNMRLLYSWLLAMPQQRNDGHWKKFKLIKYILNFWNTIMKK